jgi:tetratricopeptide (TPR) repeat protein
VHLTLVMFGRWSEALNAPMPPAELTVATGLAHYARGVAFAATGNAAETGVALERVKQAAATAKAARPPDWPTNRVLDIATHALAGEIATRAGRLEEGIVEFGTAVEIEDQLLYDEPPLWYYPMRHSFAAVLLQAGKAVDAQRVYEEDLRRFPENGWSLFGLALALRTQGKAVEADAIEARFRRAWAQADVRLAASRF